MSEHKTLQELKYEIMRSIYCNKMLLTSIRDKPEGWSLISGLWSPFYLQLRLISSYPDTLRDVATALSLLLKENAPHVNRIVGIAFAGIPIATAVSLESSIPACHTRKLVGVRNEDDFRKVLADYGQHQLVEGVLEDGDAICLIDDLVTGMDSKLVARTQVLEEVKRRELQDVQCDDIAVIVDRQQGAQQKAVSKGLALHSVINLVDEGIPLICDIMDQEEYKIVMEYLQNPSFFQNGR